MTLLASFAACAGGGDTAADERTTHAAPLASELGVDPPIADSERVSGEVAVTGATPAAGDGDVQVFRRRRMQMRGASEALAMEGVSGPVQHGFVVVVDTGGTVKVVTHKWSNADNSVVAQTECGARRPCPVAQVSADPKSGAISFTGLVLSGLDGNTGQPATSTLTGRIP